MSRLFAFFLICTLFLTTLPLTTPAAMAAPLSLQAGTATQAEATECGAVVLDIQDDAPFALLQALPTARKAAYAASKPGWATGNDATMLAADAAYLKRLKAMVIWLSFFYPACHFGADNNTAWLEEFIVTRRDLHYLLLEPGGPGTGGTLIRLEVSGSVNRDVEELILEMVRTLTQSRADFDYSVWRARWDAAVE